MECDVFITRPEHDDTTFLISRWQQEVFLNRHRTSDAIFGNGYEEVLIRYKDNHKVLSGSIVHAFSCDSSKILGPESVKEGAIAYIGYKDKFTFFYDTNKLTRPKKDGILQQFMEPVIELQKHLIKGKTAETSVDHCKEIFEKNILSLIHSDSEEDNSHIISALLWNMKHLSLDGESLAKL